MQGLGGKRKGKTRLRERKEDRREVQGWPRYTRCRENRVQSVPAAPHSRNHRPAG